MPTENCLSLIHDDIKDNVREKKSQRGESHISWDRSDINRNGCIVLKCDCYYDGDGLNMFHLGIP